MAISNIIAKGIGFSPGSTKYIVTHGFDIGAVVNVPIWISQQASSGTWLGQSAASGDWSEQSAADGTWTTQQKVSEYQ